MLNATTTPTVSGSPRLAAEIVEAMREPFAFLDGSLRLVTASPAFFHRFALDRANTIGVPLFEWGSGEWNTPLTHELFEVVAPSKEATEDTELEIRYAGTPAPRVVASVRPVREGANEIAAFLVGFSEVARDTGAPAEILLAKLRRRAGDLVAVVDPSTLTIALADGGARELTGYTPGELQGMPLEAVVHADEWPTVGMAIRKLGSSEPAARLNFRVRHRDGWFLWLEAQCDIWAEREAEPLIHVVARDVTERKRAEESLRWLARQVKLILDSAADGIFGVDRAGDVTFINPVAARLLGYPVSELLGRSYRQLLTSANGNGGSSDVIAQTIADGLGRDVREAMLRSSDGTPVIVELSCSVAREGGEVTGAVIVFRGIAERKRAEAAARRAEWLAGVGETTVAVRHEINNPLTTLLAEARLLEMGGNSPDEEREMVAAICDQARRIAAVIRRLAECQDDPVVRVEGDQRMLDLRGQGSGVGGQDGAEALVSPAA